MLLAHDLLGPEHGPLVVLLHGLSNNRRTWRLIAAELANDGYRIASLDLRGHGDSPHGERYAIDDYALDVVETIEAITTQAGTAEPVILAGHSLGGVTTLAVGQSRPDLVRALFCEDPPAFEGDAEARAESPAAKFFGAFVTQIRGWQTAGATVAEVADTVGSQLDLSGTSRADRIGRDAIEDIARGLLSFDPAAMDAAIGSEMWEGFAPLAPVTSPVAVLRADPEVGAVFRPEHVEAFAAAHPGTLIEVAEGEGHSIHESPEGHARWLEVFRAFLAALP